MRSIKTLFFAALLAASAVVGPRPAEAVNILYFEDGTVGTSSVPGALSLLGLTGSTTTATDTTNFNTLLTSNTYDLVIFGEQSNTVFPDVSAAFTNYINGGGKALATTWLSDSGLSALFDALTRVDTNETTIGTDGHPIFAGLGATVELTNPGWGVFSSSWDPDAGATGLGTLGSGSAAILGNGGRTLLFGPLFDTYDGLSEGERLVANGIDFLLDSETSVVPEPSTLAMLGLGLFGLWAGARRARVG